ncbi:50S ribosomal protein L24 [Zhaonella formicivorans]|uniref:50S ribosomal protein L24 n=1 Tax=Zhaonella formicivorans TaxID=2528593 RepID=UPI0010D52818|nr:50S ribosomal protein L24 [Zhaonella formicivorans]
MAPKVHVKKGDTVLVITGKNAGKKGKVLTVIPDKQRVIVEGVNVVKRHTKANQKMPQGGIVEKEAPISSSNVMLYCTKCNSPTRIAHKFLDDGTKVRYCKKCGEVLDK